MDSLRDEVAALVIDHIDGPESDVECTRAEFYEGCAELADRILAIPRIAEALSLLGTAQERYLRALRPYDGSGDHARFNSLQNVSPLALYLEPGDGATSPDNPQESPPSAP